MGARGGRQRVVVATRPGLEEVCRTEAAALGLPVRRVEPGAVVLDVSPRQLLVAVRWLRTATRVLVHVADLHAPTFGALERGLARIDWSPYAAPGTVPEVRVRARAAQLHHTGAVAQRVRDAVAGRAVDPSAEPAGAPAGPRVDVLVEGETASVRVDATGEPADRRGWRLATARAPLPPTVAAAALLATGWDGTAPLLDPLCGSGTVGVEAALLAAARPPAVGRRFAVECWPSFAPGTWASAAAPPRPAAAPPAPVLLSDRDAGAVEAAEGNAARAGVADRVTVARAALASAADRAAGLPPGWLVTNPPWGDRLGGGDPRDLHAALGALVRGLDGWRVAVVAADPATARHVGLPLTTAWRTTVGGTRVALLVDAR